MTAKSRVRDGEEVTRRVVLHDNTVLVGGGSANRHISSGLRPGDGVSGDCDDEAEDAYQRLSV